MSRLWRTYLLCFAQEHVEFRVAEIQSLISLFNIDIKYVHSPSDIEPFWIVQFASEDDAKLLASRSVSLRSVLELWAHAKTLSNLHEKLKNLPNNLLSTHFQETKSFKIEVETFCKHFTQQEKVAKIETFSYLPVRGPVNLNNPDVCLQYIEYYGMDANNSPNAPHDLYFGRWIMNGLRQLMKKISLKTRKFIGNTSMDPQLSILMANQAKARNGDLILDPFVGSGSLLVPAAEFGSYVIGTDIDYLMLHARTKPTRITQKHREVDESIKANLKQYNLEHRYIDVLINDFAMSFWRSNLQFDSIITDPPYGIRESTERVGTARPNGTVSEEHLGTHIPSKIEYGISNIYADLLLFAARHLKVGGRLVCWFPVFRDGYEETGLPWHPCLKLIANCEQVLSKYTSRRLLTLEKLREPSQEELESNRENSIMDFRAQYFVVREETRKERRTREAALREKNRQEAIKKNQVVPR